MAPAVNEPAASRVNVTLPVSPCTTNEPAAYDPAVLSVRPTTSWIAVASPAAAHDADDGIAAALLLKHIQASAAPVAKVMVPPLPSLTGEAVNATAPTLKTTV
jgi:hypothetical protein